MANRFLGEVTTEVEGVSYTLRMDFNAMCEFEDATGVSALVAFGDAENGTAKLTMMRAMIHAAMLRHQPDATLQQAGDIISADPEALQRLMAAAAPQEAPAQVGKPRAVGKKTA